MCLHDAIPTKHSLEETIEAAVESARSRTLLAWRGGIQSCETLMPQQLVCELISVVFPLLNLVLKDRQQQDRTRGHRTYGDRMILALPRVGTGFREQLHTLRIRINLTIALRCVGDGIRWLGGGGERDTNGLGGGADPPTSSSDGDLVEDFLFVKRNVCNNVRSTFSLTSPLERGRLVRDQSVETFAPKRGKED